MLSAEKSDELVKYKIAQILADPTLADTEFIASLRASLLTDNQKSLLDDLRKLGASHEVMAKALNTSVATVQRYALHVYAEPQENEISPRLQAYVNQMIQQSHDRLKDEFRNEIAE